MKTIALVLIGLLSFPYVASAKSLATSQRASTQPTAAPTTFPSPAELIEKMRKATGDHKAEGFPFRPGSTGKGKIGRVNSVNLR